MLSADWGQVTFCSWLSLYLAMTHLPNCHCKLLCETRNIESLPKLWPLPNEMWAACLGMCHSTTVWGVRGINNCMNSDCVLPCPSCTKAPISSIFNVLDMVNKPCFVGQSPLPIVPAGHLVPFWVRPEAVVVGGDPQESLDLTGGDNLVVATIMGSRRWWTNKGPGADCWAIVQNDTPYESTTL